MHPTQKNKTGASDLRGLLQTKVKQYQCGLYMRMLLRILVFLCSNVLLVPFGYQVSKCCSGIFDIWDKVAPDFVLKAKPSDQGEGEGGGSVRLLPPPQEVPKTRSPKRHAGAGKVQATGSKLGP